MTADVRTFRAPNMQAALDIVRREMGQDAVILHTRQIDKRRLLFFGSKAEVEVTAGIGAPARGARSAMAASGTVASGTVASATVSEELAPPPSLLPPSAEKNRESASPVLPRPTGANSSRTAGETIAQRQSESVASRTVANSNAVGNTVGHTVLPPKWSPNDVIVDLPASRPTAAASSANTASSSTMAARYTLARTGNSRTAATPTTALHSNTAIAPNALSTSAVALPSATPPTLVAESRGGRTIAAKSRSATPALPTNPSRPAAALPSTPASVAANRLESASSSLLEARNTPDDVQAIGQRLDTLQRMILELGKERTRSTLTDIPAELFPSYTQLLDNEVDEVLARELVCRTRDHAGRTMVRTPSAMQSLLTGLIEQEFRVASPLTPVRGGRKVVALVGPTGVGKTTTLAKLAANLRLREGLKVGLITVDTYRIAAVEQLKTYAELIDLPMKVVTSPSEMRAALAELEGLDLVLIDTAGRSPRDELKIQELKDCLDAAQADEVHLVLSLASGLSTLESVANKFQTVGVTSLILTKLDEATGTGLLLQAARQLRTPISYLTTGQNVPEDIEPAQRARMARLVMNLEPVQR